MMFKILRILLIVLGSALLNSCLEREDVDPLFLDEELLSIHEYVISNRQDFSSFLSIMEVGGIDLTLSARNPDGNGYTLFLPDNDAIDRFISNSVQYSSLDELLNDVEYAETFCRYHVLNMRIRTNNFPFGAFPRKTLTEDLLTVSFFTEKDSSYYKINNQAKVVYPNIELLNGYIHYIENALIPVTYTSYEWLEQHPAYSIFKSAVDLTGFDSILKLSANEDESVQEYTILLESDDVFLNQGIHSISELVSLISPGATSYTDKDNPLYNFVGYHILIGNKFIDDFEGAATLYNTLGDVPLNIDGKEIDIAINKGKHIYDTIIYLEDTTYVDYIGVMYDESNVITQNGVIHFIDHVMTVQQPTRKSINYQFYENSFINDHKNEPGIYYIEDNEILPYIEWSGSDLNYIKSQENNRAWDRNYLEISGDFEISYEIEPSIPGQYNLLIRAHAFDKGNAILEVYIDGKKVGGLLNLTTGGTAGSPFQNLFAGTVNFDKYESHIIELKTLIPGRLQWDGVIIEPI